MDVGEAEVAAGVAVGEAFVVEAHEMEEGGVPIVDVHFVVHGFVAVVVGEAVVHAAFDAAAGHPEGEAFVVVVASVGALAVGGAAELAAPDDEGVLEEIALFEVLKEAGDGLVDLTAVVFEGGSEVGVVVPVAVGDFDEADARFDEFAGHEALFAEGVGGAFADAVEFLGGGGFFAEVHDVGDFGLHAEGEFVGFDDAVDFGADAAVELFAGLVEFLDEVELGALGVGVEAGVFDVGHAGVLATKAAGELLGDGEAIATEFGALIDGGEEGTAVGAGGVAGGIDGDEAGEVFVFGAEAVEGPGSEGGADELGGAGVELGEGLGVGGEVGGHGVDDAEIIGVFGDVGEEAGNPEAAFAVPFEFPFGGHEVGSAVASGGGGGGFASVGDEFGFVVEGVDVGGGSLHAEEDDVFGFSGEVGGLGGERAACNCGLRIGDCGLG